MSRWRWLLPPLLLVAGIAALPLGLPTLAQSRGVALERAFWCGQGLCFQGIKRGAITADYAWIGVDRRLVLLRPLLSLKEGGGEQAPPVPNTASFLTGVEVRDARVSGIPFDIPPLSGMVLPERHLEGDQIRIDGDRVTAALQSPYGPVRLQVEKVGGELVIEASCSPFRYQHPRLSEYALELESVHLQGKLNEASFSGEVQSGGVHVRLEVERPESFEQRILQGNFQLQATPVQDLYDLLGSVVPEAKHAVIRGNFSAEGTFRWPLGEGDPEVELRPSLSDLAVDGLIDRRFLHGSFTFQARNAAGKPIEVEKGEGSPGWLSLAELGEVLPAAVIAAEDASFYRHPGYDLEGMVAAAEENQKAGTIRKGGSTLTQQLAKNLFLDGERTYSRKLRELLYAVELERELGKGRILELYLNVVEWGMDLRGATAAARTYFLKSPKGLLPEEAAWMAAILREPKTAWKEQYLPLRPNMKRTQLILQNMVTLSAEERGAALGREVHLVPPE